MDVDCSQPLIVFFVLKIFTIPSLICPKEMRNEVSDFVHVMQPQFEQKLFQLSQLPSPTGVVQANSQLTLFC